MGLKFLPGLVLNSAPTDRLSLPRGLHTGGNEFDSGNKWTRQNIWSDDDDDDADADDDYDDDDDDDEEDEEEIMVRWWWQGRFVMRNDGEMMTKSVVRVCQKLTKMYLQTMDINFVESGHSRGRCSLRLCMCAREFARMCEYVLRRWPATQVHFTTGQLGRHSQGELRTREARQSGSSGPSCWCSWESLWPVPLKKPQENPSYLVSPSSSSSSSSSSSLL